MNPLEQMREQIRDILNQRSGHQATLDETVGTVAARGSDAHPSDAEADAIRTARAAIVDLDEQRTAAEERLAEMEADVTRRQAAEASAARYAPTDTDTGGEGRTAGDSSGRVAVGNEERTYRPGGEHDFIVDAWSARDGNADAADRLRRNRSEMLGEMEARAIGTANVGSLVTPQYLLEEFAGILHNGRGYLNSCRRLPLSERGLTMDIPRANTGAAAATQATENSAVSDVDVDYDNELSINVRTIAGQQNVARQALERGTPGLDQLIFGDLVEDYAAKWNAQAISGDGTAGTHKGTLNATGTATVTYTDATPTVGELWPKLSDAVQQVATARKLPASLWVMHPRRWGFLTAALDSTGRPLFNFNNSVEAAVNAIGQAGADKFGEGQLVGTLQNLPVLVDAGVPVNLGAGTNEDRIILQRSTDPISFEEGDGMPRELRFEEVGSNTLTVKLVVYGYSAFTAERRPEGVAVIAGTGLVTPSF